MRNVKAQLAYVGWLLLLAAVPAIAETSANAPQPIPGAGPWQMVTIPGTSNCSARMNGETVDVMLAINNDKKMLLIAGHNDWAFPAAPVKFTLQIDGGAKVPMDGDAFNNLLLSLPTEEIAGQVKAATDLSWQLPWGEFHAKVTGLGKAFDALKVCDASKASAQH